MSLRRPSTRMICSIVRAISIQFGGVSDRALMRSSPSLGDWAVTGLARP